MDKSALHFGYSGLWRSYLCFYSQTLPFRGGLWNVIDSLPVPASPGKSSVSRSVSPGSRVPHATLNKGSRFRIKPRPPHTDVMQQKIQTIVATLCVCVRTGIRQGARLSWFARPGSFQGNPTTHITPPTKRRGSRHIPPVRRAAVPMDMSSGMRMGAANRSWEPFISGPHVTSSR